MSAFSCHTLLFRVLLQIEAVEQSGSAFCTRVVTPCSFGFFCKLRQQPRGEKNGRSCHTLLFRVLLQIYSARAVANGKILRVVTPCSFGFFCKYKIPGVSTKHGFELSHPALPGSSANSTSRRRSVMSAFSCHTLLFRVLLQIEAVEQSGSAFCTRVVTPCSFGFFCKSTHARRKPNMERRCHTLLFRVLLQI